MNGWMDGWVGGWMDTSRSQRGVLRVSKGYLIPLYYRFASCVLLDFPPQGAELIAQTVSSKPARRVQQYQIVMIARRDDDDDDDSDC